MRRTEGGAAGQVGRIRLRERGRSPKGGAQAHRNHHGEEGMPGMCVVLMGTLINYKRGCSKHFIIVAVGGGGGELLKGQVGETLGSRQWPF